VVADGSQSSPAGADAAVPVPAVPGALAVVLVLDRPEMLTGAYAPHNFIPGSLLQVGSFRAERLRGPLPLGARRPQADGAARAPLRCGSGSAAPSTRSA
jgi:hypothetical protein